MNYVKKEIKQGINLHLINTDKFKTNLVAVFLTLPLNRQTITLNSLIPAILRRGTKKYPTMNDLSIKLEELYGSSFDCGIEKRGDNCILKFYVESVNEIYINTKEALLKEIIDFIFEVIFNPVLENGVFKKEYVEGEKETIKQLINGKIDSKDVYAIERTVETMFEGEGYGLYKYGYIEDIENITPEIAYNHYKKIINEARIDVFVSGDFNDDVVMEYVTDKTNINSRNYNVLKNISKANSDQKVVKESMDIVQGKLIVGLKIDNFSEDMKRVANVYNTLLGGSSNSKMFQNVREKASLAYTAGSNFLMQKNSILVRCGIEIQNYQKTLDLIKVQIDQMENGDFTDKEIENAKKYIKNSMNSLKDEQSGLIDYSLSQDLFETNKKTIDEYIDGINKVTKNEIIELAKNIKIDTIYFLTNDNIAKGEE